MPRAAVVHFSEPGQPFWSQFVLYLAVWTGLAGATRLTRSDFRLNLLRGACKRKKKGEMIKVKKTNETGKRLIAVYMKKSNEEKEKRINIKKDL